MRSYDMATWCQVPVSNSPSKPWSPPTCVCANKYIVKSCGKMAFTFQCRHSVVSFCISKMSRVGLTGSSLAFRVDSLWEAPGHSGQGLYWPSHHSILTKLQNKEHVTETLPSSGSPATRGSTSQRSEASPRLMLRNLKIMVAYS